MTGYMLHAMGDCTPERHCGCLKPRTDDLLGVITGDRPMSPDPVDSDGGHEWGYITFAYRAWTECSCGFEPQSQEEFDQHTKEFQREDDRG